MRSTHFFGKIGCADIFGAFLLTFAEVRVADKVHAQCELSACKWLQYFCFLDWQAWEDKFERSNSSTVMSLTGFHGFWAFCIGFMKVLEKDHLDILHRLDKNDVSPHLLMHNQPKKPMQYAICILPVNQVSFHTKAMHYEAMHYENMYCTCQIE